MRLEQNTPVLTPEGWKAVVKWNDGRPNHSDETLIPVLVDGETNESWYNRSELRLDPNRGAKDEPPIEDIVG